MGVCFSIVSLNRTMKRSNGGNGICGFGVERRRLAAEHK